jgi:metallo-beta-lactamase family protein
MRLQFHGADRTVTGSCHQLEINGLRLLLDLGMYQGKRDESRMINEQLPDNLKSINAVILSHGHLDHCGRLPMLVRSGYAGPIYCTSATADVARVVMQDAAKIQEEDAEFLNRQSTDRAQQKITPLFRQTDVSGVLKLFKRIGYEKKTDLGNGVSFTYYDAGHILGSAYVLLEWTEGATPRSLLFTADVGRYNTPIIRDPHDLPRPVDFVITESTYGSVKHAPMDQVEPQLLDCVQFCLKNNSRLLLPSFAVGRTQTVLYYIQKFIREKRIPEIPIYVDSPMGVEISRITQEHREGYDDQTLAAIDGGDIFGFSKVTFASSIDDSKKINLEKRACVIIASSPTCEFGRILHHLSYSVERQSDMIVFVGWTPPNTLGRKLQNGARRVRIYDRFYDVKCQVRTIHGLSAHADGDELLRFLKPTIRKETTAFVVHGEEDRAEIFAARLLNAGMGSAAIPAMYTTFVSGAVPAPKIEIESPPATKGEAVAAQE